VGFLPTKHESAGTNPPAINRFLTEAKLSSTYRRKFLYLNEAHVLLAIQAKLKQPKFLLLFVAMDSMAKSKQA